MDFEIEDSEEESYDLSARKQGNSRQPPSSYNSSKANYNYNPKPAVQPQQQPKRNSGFNDDDNDDDPYNFEYNADNNKAKSKQGGRIAAFSPAAKAGGGGVGNSFTDPNNNSNNALRLSAVSNNDASALDRAKNLLDRYSGKNFKAPESNFKSGRASQHFDEDDISIDEDEDEEEDEDEDENEESRGHRKLNHDKKNFSVDIEMSDSNADFDPKLISFSKPSTSSTTTAAAVSKPPPPTSAPPVHTYPERVINKTFFFFILIYFFSFCQTLTRTDNQQTLHSKNSSSNNRPKGFNESAIYSDFNESVPEESVRDLEESGIKTEKDEEEEDEDEDEEEEYDDEEFDEAADEDDDDQEEESGKKGGKELEESVAEIGKPGK
jgi:hypothetical protein